jgi:hypothetical protein
VPRAAGKDLGVKIQSISGGARVRPVWIPQGQVLPRHYRPEPPSHSAPHRRNLQRGRRHARRTARYFEACAARAEGLERIHAAELAKKWWATFAEIERQIVAIEPRIVAVAAE